MFRSSGARPSEKWLKRNVLTCITISIVALAILTASAANGLSWFSTGNDKLGAVRQGSIAISPPAWSDLRGVVYHGLCDCNYPGSPQTSSFQQLPGRDWNLMRVFVSWRGYAADPSGYISSLQQVASAAQANGIYVIYSAGAASDNACTDNFWPCALGTPSTTFWSQLWANQLTYNGTDSWDAEWNDFWVPVINAVGSNPSTIGYEILNEPTQAGSPLSELHQYNQFFAQKFRSTIAPSQYIMFQSPCPSCGYDLDSSTPFAVAPTGIANLAIDFHHYDYTDIQQYMAFYNQVSQSLGGIPVLIGEWAVCFGSGTGCSANQSQVDSILQTYESSFRQYGFANTYFSWACGNSYLKLLTSSCGEYWLDTDIAQYQGSGLGTSTTSTTSISSTQNSTSLVSTTTTTTESGSSTNSSTSTSTQSSTNFSSATSSSLTSTTISKSSSVGSLNSTTSLATSSTQRQVPGDNNRTSTSSSNSSSPSQSNPIARMLSLLSPSRNPPVAYGLATYETLLLGGLFAAAITIRRYASKHDHGWRW